MWESPEALQNFFESKLGAAVNEAGVPANQPQLLPVHNHLQGSGATAGTIMIAEVAGFTADDYDRMTADLAAHSGEGSQHPAVSHVAPFGPDGMYVVDVWGSEQEFGEYAQAELEPRGGDRFAEMRTRFAKVRNHVQAKSTAKA